MQPISNIGTSAGVCEDEMAFLRIYNYHKIQKIILNRIIDSSFIYFSG